MTACKTDEHYKAYLQGRWNRLTWRSGPVLALALVSCFTYSPNLSGLTFLSAFAQLVGALIAFGGCIFPLLVLRHKLLKTGTQPVPPNSTWLSLLQSFLTQSRSLRLIIWHGVWGFLWSLIYCGVVEARYGEGRSVDLALSRPTSRFPHHLNERFIFLTLCNTTFGVVLGLIEAFRINVDADRWSMQKQTRRERIISLAQRDLEQLAPLVFVHLAIFVTVYSGYRTTLWASVIRSSHGLLAPFVRNFARPSNFRLQNSFGLVLRVFIVQLVTLVACRVPAVISDVQATQGLDFTPLARKGGMTADKYLLEALQSSDDFYLHFTLQEIADMSFQAGRRELVFADIGGKPTLWNQLWRGLMLHFGKSYQRLSTRGGRLVIAAPSSASTATIVPVQPLQVKEASNVFQTSAIPAKVSPVRQAENTALRIDQVFLNGVDGLYIGFQRVLSLPWLAAYRAWEKLLPSLEAQAEARPAIKAVQNDIIEAKGMLVTKAQLAIAAAQDPAQTVGSLLESKSPIVATPAGWWNAYVQPVTKQGWDVVTAVLARRWALDEINFVLARRRLDVYAVKALAAFIAASYTEDTYGQAQQVIPATLEAMAKYHDELVAYRAEFLMTAERRGEVWREEATKAWKEEAEPIQKTIERSIRWIEQTFGTSMRAFSFPPRVARVLKAVTTAPL